MFRLSYIFTALISVLGTLVLAQPPGGPGGRATQQDPVPPDVTVHRDLAYVTNGHPRQKLDLYLPQNVGTPPLIILIHGGAFRTGSKEMMNPSPFLAQGYAVASLNYRLSGHAIFPAQIEDCKAAVRWLRANAAKYGYHPQRFGAHGTSAGGHLVAMLGTAGTTRKFDVGEHPDISSQVQAVADFFGPTDFLQMDAHRIAGGMVHNAPDSPESALIGGNLQDQREKAAAANPITYITKDCPPFLVVHGDHDPLVPHHQSELLVAALQKAGTPVTFYTVKDGGHGGFKDPEVGRLLQAFFSRHLQ